MAAKIVFALARLITAGLLIWALARHPIGYYTVLRLVTTGVCLYAAYLAVQDEQTGWAFIFGGIAVLFQPFDSIADDTGNLELHRRYRGAFSSRIDSFV